MGLGPIINGRQQPITPVAGSWAETVNKTPVNPPAPAGQSAGTPTGSYLWLGDFRL